eukprot:m.339394 g.339394  ORF g.339394 m.339394 type:complete len:113 (-) comp18789_c0_seq1:1851-2189(-)
MSSTVENSKEVDNVQVKLEAHNPFGKGQSRRPLAEQVRECEQRWASEILKEAASSENPVNLLLAGDICDRGYGMMADKKEAKKWWTKACNASPVASEHAWATKDAQKRLNQN